MPLRSQAEIDAVNDGEHRGGNPDQEGPLGISVLQAKPTGAYIGHDLGTSVQTGLNETSNALGLIAERPRPAWPARSSTTRPNGRR